MKHFFKNLFTKPKTVTIAKPIIEKLCHNCNHVKWHSISNYHNGGYYNCMLHDALVDFYGTCDSCDTSTAEAEYISRKASEKAKEEENYKFHKATGYRVVKK